MTGGRSNGRVVYNGVKDNDIITFFAERCPILLVNLYSKLK